MEKQSIFFLQHIEMLFRKWFKHITETSTFFILNKSGLSVVKFVSAVTKIQVCTT